MAEAERVTFNMKIEQAKNMFVLHLFFDEVTCPRWATPLSPPLWWKGERPSAVAMRGGEDGETLWTVEIRTMV